MPPDQTPPTPDSVRHLAATAVLLRAEVVALRLLVLKANPGLVIDGEPVKEWLRRLSRLSLERQLGHLADENPALAAYVQQMVKRDDDEP
jgi:hypothetical protein